MEANIILQENGLSKTRNRVFILQSLSLASGPLSVRDLIEILPVRCDKSTVHRTLNVLFERKIVQRIIVDHEVKYALSKEHDGSNGHAGDHIHFKCSVCSKLFCLKDIEIGDYTLPDGFVKEENQFLVIGKCAACQE